MCLLPSSTYVVAVEKSKPAWIICWKPSTDFYEGVCSLEKLRTKSSSLHYYHHVYICICLWYVRQSNTIGKHSKQTSNHEETFWSLKNDKTFCNKTVCICTWAPWAATFLLGLLHLTKKSWLIKGMDLDGWRKGGKHATLNWLTEKKSEKEGEQSSREEKNLVWSFSARGHDGNLGSPALVRS